MKFSKHILKNGLRVLLIPMKDTQTVTSLILVQAGSKYESKSTNGLSHFLEHMFFKGTHKRPTAKAITEELDSVGGEYNAFTSKEETGYWVKVPKQHFALSLDVISDMFLDPLLQQAEIEKERGVILQELSMYQDLPHKYVFEVFEKTLYGDQSAGWEIIGTKENIKKFQRKDFVLYRDTFYTPKATTIIIAGNFDEKKTLNLIRASFNKMPKRDKAEKLATKQSQETPIIKAHLKKTDQLHLILGVRSCNMFSADRYTTGVMATILGGGMSSRVFSNIREKHGLCYYIDVENEQNTDTGYFIMRAGIDSKNLNQTVALMLKEMTDLKNNPVKEKELAKAKEYIKGKTLMALESSTQVASFFGEQELFRGKIKNPQELFAQIDAVTAKDIQRVAKKIFVNKSLVLTYIGNQKPNKKLITDFKIC